MDHADRDAAREGRLEHFINRPEALSKTACDEDGRSLLHIASTSGNAELVQKIAECGGQNVVNECDDEGWTPLLSTVSSGHLNVASFLISIGADVNKPNSGGRTALHYAASKGHVDLIKLLIKSGAKVNSKDSTGSTALHRASSAGKAEAVRALVEEGGARLEEEDKQGQTALLVSIEAENNRIALYLASKGANLEAADKEGATPLGIVDGTFKAALISASKQQGMEED